MQLNTECRYIVCLQVAEPFVQNHLLKKKKESSTAKYTTSYLTLSSRGPSVLGPVLVSVGVFLSTSLLSVLAVSNTHCVIDLVLCLVFDQTSTASGSE